MRRVLYIGAAVMVALGVLFALGPRVEVARAPAVEAPPPIEQLEGWIVAREGRFDDITPGAEKQIVWADPQRKSRTPLALIYLHGFSATRQETRPWPESVAHALGANLFNTRLAGHGRSGLALGDATAAEWLGDALEALAIGERLGERVVIMGTSTGGSLAIWLAAQPEAQRAVAGLVLMSPNLGVADPRQGLIFWPWGHLAVELTIGEWREWEPETPARARYWTTRYPSRAILAMAGIQKTVGAVPVERPTTPALVLYSPHDPLLDIEAIRGWIAANDARTGHPVEDALELGNHVLAGDIVAPSRTEALTRVAVDFIRELGARR